MRIYNEILEWPYGVCFFHAICVVEHFFFFIWFGRRNLMKNKKVGSRAKDVYLVFRSMPFFSSASIEIYPTGRMKGWWNISVLLHVPRTKWTAGYVSRANDLHPPKKRWSQKKFFKTFCPDIRLWNTLWFFSYSDTDALPPPEAVQKGRRSASASILYFFFFVNHL